MSEVAGGSIVAIAAAPIIIVGAGLALLAIGTVGGVSLVAAGVNGMRLRIRDYCENERKQAKKNQREAREATQAAALQSLGAVLRAALKTGPTKVRPARLAEEPDTAAAIAPTRSAVERELADARRQELMGALTSVISGARGVATAVAVSISSPQALSRLLARQAEEVERNATRLLTEVSAGATDRGTLDRHAVKLDALAKSWEAVLDLDKRWESLRDRCVSLAAAKRVLDSSLPEVSKAAAALSKKEASLQKASEAGEAEKLLTEAETLLSSIEATVLGRAELIQRDYVLEQARSTLAECGFEVRKDAVPEAGTTFLSGWKGAASMNVRLDDDMRLTVESHGFHGDSCQAEMSAVLSGLRQHGIDVRKPDDPGQPLLNGKQLFADTLDRVVEVLKHRYGKVSYKVEPGRGVRIRAQQPKEADNGSAPLELLIPESDDGWERQVVVPGRTETVPVEGVAEALQEATRGDMRPAQVVVPPPEDISRTQGARRLPNQRIQR